jgi:O-antigen/teichoic acid export membrane protein
MFHYAYPVMLSGLAGMTNEMFSRITLEWWLPDNFYPGKSSSYAIGVFGACYKYAAIMNLGIQAFRFASEPFFFSNATDKNSPALFAKVNYYFVIVGCIVLLGVSINMDILKHYLQNEEYWEGLHIVPILLTGYLFLGIYFNFSVWFKISDKTYFGTVITVIGATITIVGNFILIPISGYLGSSIITLVTYASMAVICYGLGQKHFPIPYTIGKSLLYITTTLVIVYATGELVFASQWVATFVHTVILGGFVGCIFLIERKNLNTQSLES